jgi:hypothetical protein
LCALESCPSAKEKHRNKLTFSVAEAPNEKKKGHPHPQHNTAQQATVEKKEDQSGTPIIQGLTRFQGMSLVHHHRRAEISSWSVGVVFEFECVCVVGRTGEVMAIDKLMLFVLNGRDRLFETTGSWTAVLLISRQ